MNQLLGIEEDKIVIEKLRLKYLEGNVMHVGNLNVEGGLNVAQSVNLAANLSVNGYVEADTIKVKNLITEDATQTDAFTFSADVSKKLDGKGLIWGLPDYTAQLIYKAEPRRILSSESIDLHKDARYLIDGKDVLLANRLGNAIQHSNLSSVGVLTQLEVDGNTNLGNSLFVNSYLNRTGINTEKPNAALSVVDNTIEVIIGSNENNRAVIGTWSPQGLDIVTDNTTRISIQGNSIVFGSEKSKNSIVKINGVLEVDSIVTDVRIERTTPIEFLEDVDSGVYGKGLAWKSKKALTRQFFLLPNPDRFFSTENIDLAEGKGISIGNEQVLSKSSIGNSVVYSNLQTLGTLENLTVAGNVNLNDVVEIRNQTLTVQRRLSIMYGSNTLSITDAAIESNTDSFKIKIQDSQELVLSEQGIVIGNKDNTTRVINAYGRLAVNTTNPHPEAAFAVEGPVVMSGRKFTDGEGIPKSGVWNKGDIVWNNNPQESSYIGWVCISSGTPGQWKSFGYIGER